MWRSSALVSTWLPWCRQRGPTCLYWKTWQSWSQQADECHHSGPVFKISCSGVWEGLQWEVPSMFHCCQETHRFHNNSTGRACAGNFSLLWHLSHFCIIYVFVQYHCFSLLCFFCRTGWALARLPMILLCACKKLMVTTILRWFNSIWN